MATEEDKKIDKLQPDDAPEKEEAAATQSQFSIESKGTGASNENCGTASFQSIGTRPCGDDEDEDRLGFGETRTGDGEKNDGEADAA